MQATEKHTDTRFCYGANCTWYGSIREVANTATHPAHAQLNKDKASLFQHEAHGLPCCPICGGMLMELPNREEWFKGMDMFEMGTYPGANPHPHAGYRAMFEWQKNVGRCFPGIGKLVEAYKEKTGITVDITP